MVDAIISIWVRHKCVLEDQNLNGGDRLLLTPSITKFFTVRSALFQKLEVMVRSHFYHSIFRLSIQTTKQKNKTGTIILPNEKPGSSLLLKIQKCPPL
jgi:hypothetical protein